MYYYEYKRYVKYVIILFVNYFFMTTDVVVRSGFLLVLCDLCNMRTLIHYMLCNIISSYILLIEYYIYILPVYSPFSDRV